MKYGLFFLLTAALGTWGLEKAQASTFPDAPQQVRLQLFLNPEDRVLEDTTIRVLPGQVLQWQRSIPCSVEMACPRGVESVSWNVHLKADEHATVEVRWEVQTHHGNMGVDIFSSRGMAIPGRTWNTSMGRHLEVVVSVR